MADMTTKERILDIALTLFSQRGYDGVSMRDIAVETGIKAASIYNYYAGKEDLLDAIVQEMDQLYHYNSQMIPGDADDAAAFFGQIAVETLVKLASDIFLYFLQDDYAARFRRLMTMEQFRNTHLRQVYHSHFIVDPLQFQAYLFQVFMQQGTFKRLDPQIAALHFYGPIFALLNQYDGAEDPAAALDALRRHVEQFALLYSN